VLRIRLPVFPVRVAIRSLRREIPLLNYTKSQTRRWVSEG